MSEVTPVKIQPSLHGHWQSVWVFIMAAVGSAVGLGNIWKFPYVAGEHGGGAFVLVYLLCIIVMGVPIMLAEVLLGCRARLSPVNAWRSLARESQASRLWVWVGLSGTLAGLLILSFYSVIAGWAIHYFLLAVSGAFAGMDSPASTSVFQSLLVNVNTLVFWHSVFMMAVIVITSSGVAGGLSWIAKRLMPLLMMMLLWLMFYSAYVGDFDAASRFLFAMDFTRIDRASLLTALGHAFFTLSLGMGAMMAYGAYWPKSSPSHGRVSLGKAVLTIAGLDTLISLMAGMVIFPIVFSHEALTPSSGPGLLFVSLPVAFGSIPGGSWVATLFFGLVIVAALSSAIALFEPALAWAVESRSYQRASCSMVLGFIVWLIGLGTVFSFNRWQDITFFGRTFFDSLDLLTAHILLPFGGFMMACFVGWKMKPSFIEQELGVSLGHGVYRWWYVVLRYLTPILLFAVFAMTLWNEG